MSTPRGVHVLGTLRADPEARLGHWTQITPRGELSFEVVHTLIDEEGEGAGQIEAAIELEDVRMPAGPMLRLIAFRA